MHPRNNRRTGLMSLLLVLFGAAATPAWALPEDSQQPVEVSADNARFDQKSGQAVYRGNVQVKQGTLLVRGDTLNAQVDASGNLSTATTFGKPAHYQQKNDPNKGLITADASQIQFDNATGIVTLTGNAILRQDGTVFSGPRIVYSTIRKQVEASGDSSQRVQLVFPPSARNTVKSGSGSSKP